MTRKITVFTKTDRRNLNTFVLWGLGGLQNMDPRFVFLDLKATFNSVHRAVLCPCFSLKDEPEKFIPLFQSPYMNSQSWVRASDDLSPEFITRSDARQGCSLLLGWLKRYPYPCARIVAVIFSQSETCLTVNMRTTFRYWVKTRVSCGFSSVVQTSVETWYELCTFEMQNTVAELDRLEAELCSRGRTTGWSGQI